MRDVDALQNKQHQLDSQTPCSPSQPFPKSMLPGSQHQTSELLPVSPTQPQPQSQSTRHPLAIHNPTVIRPLIRRFSPPFKPFGSKDPAADEELAVSSDSPMIMPSVLASDLASNQFQNRSNSDVIVLSAPQSHPIVMIPSSSKHKRSQSRFTTLGGDLNEPDRPRNSSDEALKQFTIDSDVEMQDPSSLKRPRRNGDKSARQKTVNPFSASQSSISELSIPSNTSRPLPLTRSPKSSRSSTRPSNSQGPTSPDLKQVEDEHKNNLPKSKPSPNGVPTAGRAATARRALFASSDTTSFSWAGLEQPSEPLPSSSTLPGTSPRLRPTRRLSPNHVASQANITGSGSSASGEDVEVRTMRPPDDVPRPPDEMQIDDKPIKKAKNKPVATSFQPKRPKTPHSPTCAPVVPDPSVSTSNTSKNDKIEVKRRIATLLPATEPDESGQYESSTCHQCRVKTTRPKMICDQSQDPNCVVRVCHTCLMIRTVYDDMPELRPPQFQFVPGGTMLCVKCRDICPCASCRRRRGEKEHSRRGLGSNLKGFYGLTPDEREQALARKKEKQEAARQKKESRPPSEKKTPSTFRREVSSIRGMYDDDEHERLQHWAPLPVFPPLPTRRKKKRKRLEIMEGVRLDSQASDTNSDSSCSDSDSCDETDSDSRSLSSRSSYRSNSRAHVVLGAVSFQLPLSSNTRSTVPLLTKRWRSNFSCPIKGSQSNFPDRAYQTASRKSHGDKAPVVWIKSGAMVQARKPPTTEFMQRLAEEQKGRSTSDSNAADNADATTPSLAVDRENLSLNPLDQTHSASLDKMTIPLSNSPANASTNYSIDGSNLQSLTLNSKYPLVNSNQSKLACTCNLDQFQPSLESLDNPLVSHSKKCALFGSSSYSKPMPLRDDLGMCTDTPLSLMGEACLTDHPTQFGMQIDEMKEFEGLTDNPESFSSLRTNDRHQFDQSVDHQTYLAGLTDEQLSALLKEGHYVMAKQGFLPSSISPDGLPIKFNHDSDQAAHHQFSTGISPELISASLPFAPSKEGGPDREGSGQPLTELTEEDQEARLIEAANWAAVWGATDGAGGFMITKSTSQDENQQQDPRSGEHNREPTHPDDPSNQAVKNPDGSTNTRTAPAPNVSGLSTEHSASHSRADPEWVNHASGADKELFLRAMKSRVGDEWLTDVMPLDGC